MQASEQTPKVTHGF